MGNNDSIINLEGEIIESSRGDTYTIKDNNGKLYLGYAAGRIKKTKLRILPGDNVLMELSIYDIGKEDTIKKARIVKRLNKVIVKNE
jgi:translation initiation factor IF-1